MLVYIITLISGLATGTLEAGCCNAMLKMHCSTKALLMAVGVAMVTRVIGTPLKESVRSSRMAFADLFTKIKPQGDELNEAYLSEREENRSSLEEQPEVFDKGQHLNSAQPIQTKVSGRQVMLPRTTHSPLCISTTQILNPKNYFNTQDNFTPDRYRKVECSGSIGYTGYPQCGELHFLDCVTKYQDLHFTRKPSNNCNTWYTDVMPNVAVGCSCMWPQ